jgi:hypothetical protein
MASKHGNIRALVLIAAIALAGGYGFALEDPSLIMALGVETAEFLGQGVSGNVFSPGGGVCFELGLGSILKDEILLGMSIDGMANKVKGSSVDAVMFPIYLDYRLFFPFSPNFSGSNQFLYFFSADWYMCFIGYDGVVTPDFIDALTLGAGMEIVFDSQFYLEIVMKPSLVIANDLGQWRGLQVQTKAGWMIGD